MLTLPLKSSRWVLHFCIYRCEHCKVKEAYSKDQIYLQNQYGKVFSLKLFDRNMIVLNDAKSVKEILDLRANISSNRPPWVSDLHFFYP